MLINESGYVGIGTTILTDKLTINGTANATLFSGSGASLANLSWTNSTGRPTNFQADWTSTIIIYK